MKALFLVLLFLVGLAVSARDGRDRWIYIAFVVATLYALLHYRHAHSFSHWLW